MKYIMSWIILNYTKQKTIPKQSLNVE